MNGVDQHLIRMRLFPLSLRDEAWGWLQSLHPAEEAYALLEQMACNNYQWPSERSIGRRAAGVHEVDQMAVLSAQVVVLSNQIKIFTTREASSSQYKPMVEKKPSLKDLLSTFVVEIRNRFNKNEASLDNMETYMVNMGATVKSLEVQVGHLVTSIKSLHSGKFPSDAEVNPREQCKVITLGIGTELEPLKCK
ncbi:DNA-directed DNA polymerase [Melia azedarach]|uniref:DNA-directed DNA polymerase n=1 Tax=Melia azedarach TaxID=155640 RepID=A0ACC1YQF0_MELAZ|nr:DNA-directed DNA polymerase [Melia azedarach]